MDINSPLMSTITPNDKIRSNKIGLRDTSKGNKTRLTFSFVNGYTQTTAKLMKLKVHLLLVPWFAVNAAILLNMLITTFITKRTPCCAPIVALISIYRTFQLNTGPFGRGH